MVARLVNVTGRGALDLLSGGTTSSPGTPAGGTAVVSSTAEGFTVADPIPIADMRSFLGITTSYGGSGNVGNTSVRTGTGPAGTTTKAVVQDFPAVVSGSTSNNGMPPTGTGIALTSAPLAGGAVNEASIEYDFRAVATGGPPWGWGGKLPGLGGIGQGQSSVPTGGSPSPYGFSARLMFRRIGTQAAANTQANLVGYFYSPDLPAGAIGNDIPTGKVLNANTWHHLKQYHKVNTVTTEGSTSPPANGIHRIWLDGVLCWESTTTVYRYYSDANINRLCWDNFYGGSTRPTPRTRGVRSSTRRTGSTTSPSRRGDVMPRSHLLDLPRPVSDVAVHRRDLRVGVYLWQGSSSWCSNPQRWSAAERTPTIRYRAPEAWGVLRCVRRLVLAGVIPRQFHTPQGLRPRRLSLARCPSPPPSSTQRAVTHAFPTGPPAYYFIGINLAVLVWSKQKGTRSAPPRPNRQGP
jgi:hypothetical protein